MLCQLCKVLKFDSRVFENLQQYATWEELVKSAKEGCDLCWLIERDLRLTAPSMDFDNGATSLGPIQYNFSVQEFLYSLNVHIPSPPASPHCVARFGLFQLDEDRISTNSSSDLPKLWPASGRQISPNAGSHECFQWAGKQIEECLKEHKVCTKYFNAEERLPSRVLDLQCFSDSDDLRLYESQGETETYATLSHCWGTARMLMTTQKATLNSRKERIQFNDLPRSFQDAVKITRGLKIRYLWIDSICIVQDSIEDWAEQSAHMARIYKSALVTLAFTDYKDAYQPILCNRPVLPNCKMGDEMPNIYLRSIYPRVDDSASQHEPSKILTEPHAILGNSSCLGSRAWAFQERLLSRRVLNHTRDQLIWECRECIKREANVFAGKSYMNLPDVESKKKDVYRFWFGVVEYFSNCALTFSRDIFPALSGIASEVNSLLNDTYIAGMWKSDLRAALLWRPAEYGTVVSEYRAPSWSWASLSGDIKYDILREGYLGEDQLRNLPHDRDVQILDHHVHQVTSDSLGMIDEASLKIRGYCAPVNSAALAPGSKSVEAIDLLPVPQPGKDRLALSDWRFDTRVAPEPSHQYVLVQVSRWALGRKIAVINVDDDTDETLSLADNMEIPYIGTLILQETEKDGEYRRVGHAQIRHEHRGKILWQQRDLILI